MLTVIISLALLGLLVWAVTKFIPMPPAFQKLITIVAVVVAVVYVLNVLGLGTHILAPVKLGH